MIRKSLLFAATLLSLAFSSGMAEAATCPTFTTGLVLSAAQWQACFDAKLNTSGGVMSGKLTTSTSSGANAGLNIIPGSTPVSPLDGDMWTTTAGLYVRINGTTIGPLGNATGTVTSVGLSLPAIFNVSGSPITSSGTLTGALANESANLVFAGPATGAAAAPTFRSLVSADLSGSFTGITGVGTLTAGTWDATAIGLTYGGTGANLSATGGAHQVLKQATTGAAITVGQLACADLSDASTGCSQNLSTWTGSTSITTLGTISTGTVPLSHLATQAADTVVANASGSIAVPTAVAIGSCSGGTNALTYNTTTHAFGCNTITASTPGGSNTQVQYNNSGAFGGISGATTDGTALTMASSDFKLSGSTSGTVTLNAPATGGGILTLPSGTATIPALQNAGTWSGIQTFGNHNLKLAGAVSGTIELDAPSAAGTNTITFPAGTTDFSLTGGTSEVVKQTSSGGAFTVGQLACADLSDASSGCNGAVVTPPIPLSDLANQAANTVVMNATTGIAAPTAVAIPNCATSNSALIYNTGTSTWGCNTIATSGSPGGSNTQLQYNNSGAFGGISNVTWDGTLFKINPTQLEIIGQTPSLGSGTPDPFDLRSTWNSGTTAFAGLYIEVVDTASASTSKIAKFLNTTSGAEFDVNKDGTLTAISKTSTDPSLSLEEQGGTSGTLIWPTSSGSYTIKLPAGSTDFTATGGAHQVLQQSTLDGAFTVGQLSCSDLSGGCGGGVTWPANGDIVISNTTSSPAGLAEVDGDCVIGSAGVWTAGSCSGGSAVTSVSNSDGTLTISPTTGAVVASLALGHANSWSGVQTLASPVLNGTVSGTAVSTAATASKLTLRDANANSFANNFLSNATLTTSAGGTTTLTAASSRYQALTGSAAQTYQLPDATTLSLGPWFVFNDNSSGALSIVNNGSAAVFTVPAGGVTQCGPTSISTANGTWDCHSFLPNTVSWGTGTVGLYMNNVLSTSSAVGAGAASCTSPTFQPQRGASTTGWSGDGTKDCVVVGGADVFDVTSSGVSTSGTASFGAAGVGGATANASTASLLIGTGTPTTAVNGIQFGSDTSANLYRYNPGVIASDGYIYGRTGLSGTTVQTNMIYPLSSVDLVIETRPSDGTHSIIFKSLGSTPNESGRFDSAGNLVIGSLHLTDNYSGSGIYGTSGAYVQSSGTITDTTSTGTVATAYGEAHGNHTWAATNATTLTNAFGEYVVAPTAGTNVTMTNKYALGADNIYDAGSLFLAGSSSGIAIVNAPSSGGGTLTLPGGTDTLAGIAASQTLTNKTISGASNTITNLSGSNISTGTVASTYLPTDVVYYDQNQSFTKAQRATPVTISISTSTFTPNFDTGQNFTMTLVHASCPCTLANPSTTPVAGQSGILVINQSATGSDTIGTWGSDYIAAGGTSTITLSTAASAIDVFSYYVIDSTHILLSAGALNASH